MPLDAEASTTTTPLLRTPAAATYLDVSPQTMRNWRSAGSGPPAIKLNGGAIRYRLADLDAWIAAQREDPDAA